MLKGKRESQTLMVLFELESLLFNETTWNQGRRNKRKNKNKIIIHYFGQHGVAEVSAVASQQEVPRFNSQFLRRPFYVKFSCPPCVYVGKMDCTYIARYSPKTCSWGIGYR